MIQRLLVADDHATHQLLGLTFAAAPVEVIAVSDGEEARRRLRSERPDVVLAATSLPRVDGYALAEFVRQEPALAGVPVLLLASPFDAVDQERLHRSGAAGVLIKPLDPDTVVKWVTDLIATSTERAAGMRDAAGQTSPPLTVATARPAATDSAAGPDVVPALPAPARLDLAELGEALAQFDAESPRRAGLPRDLEFGPASTASSAASASDVADAFDALLAAEQGGDLRPAVPVAVSEADLDRIAARVLTRLHERVPATMIREIVTEVAERLVREEIARIRAKARAASD